MKIRVLTFHLTGCEENIAVIRCDFVQIRTIYANIAIHSANARLIKSRLQFFQKRDCSMSNIVSFKTLNNSSTENFKV